MKRIKIFLGVFCLLTASSAAYATKVFRVVAPDYYLYYIGFTPYCATLPIETLCLPIYEYPCTYSIDLGGGVGDYDTYDIKSAGNCLTPLKDRVAK